jgi:hypothetical protein
LLTPEECEAMRGIVCDRRQPAERFGKNKRTLDLSEAPQAYKDIEDVNRIPNAIWWKFKSVLLRWQW